MTLKKLIPLSALILFPNLSFATVWWPEEKAVSPSMTIYKDYTNPNQFYYIAKGVRPARTSDSTEMVSHALFFNRLKPSESYTQYNLTFEPILADTEVLRAESELKRLNGDQVTLSPMPITTVNFEVTQQLAKDTQISAPFTVAVPNWTGDLHAFNQRFSVVMRGKAYEAEPSMSRFMTNKAGNAFVGTMHYGFRGVQRSFEGYAKINVSQFMSKFKAHASARFGFWGSADIATAIDSIKDDSSVFVDIKKDAGYESEVWKSLTEKMISTLFQPVPPAPDAPTGEGSGLFRLSVSYSQVSRDQTITLDLKEAIIKDHSGDIDITGGAMDAATLDQNIKYFCDMWAKYDVTANRCVNVCEPVSEYYDPSTHGCKAAFGSSI